MRQQAAPVLALLAWGTFMVSVDSSITYCASDSTGSGSANFSIYQSNGNCEEHCSGSAFGILLDKNCWCSDIAPSKDSRVSTSKCDDDCPGFPDDSCGNEADGYYAYIQLGSPSGTASDSSTSSTSTSTSTSTDDSDSTTTTTDDATSTSSHSSVVETETHGNQVTTVTVDGSSSAATSAAADSASDTQETSSSSGLSGGSIAGIVVGVVGGIALVVAAVIFFLAKKRQQNQDGYQSNGIDGRQSKGSQMSYANIADNHSHTLSNGSSNVPQRMPTFTDNRLNTGAVLYPNDRRASDLSLQDNEDYSRPVLRLTNPD
ncbi:hypothetical protein BDV18DRAFT_133114 [Aspergillus unguis]